MDEKWMQEALVEASLALGAGEVPVGAVIVRDGDTTEPYVPAEGWAGPISHVSSEDVRTGRIDTL